MQKTEPVRPWWTSPWWLTVPAASSLVITLLFHGQDLEGFLGLTVLGVVQFMAVALGLFLAAHRRWGKWTTLVVSVLAWFLSAAALYAWGRFGAWLTDPWR
jgi:hypothetical protein